MKLAIITDIHGNRFALDAVLDDIAKQNADEIIVAGDNVNIHPFSRECWEVVNALNCPMIQGNHEYYLYTYNTPDADPAWQTVRFQMLAWHHAQFTQGELDEMRELPKTYHVADTPLPLVVTHASLRNLFDNVEIDTPDETLDTFFPTQTDTVIVRGHNHRWQTRQWTNDAGARNQMLTIASLGMPYDCGLKAQYGILMATKTGWQLEKRAVTYDRQAAIDAFDDEYLAGAGAMARVSKLELQTGENYFIAFLTQYLAPINRGEIAFETAVDQYLRALS